MTGVTEVKYEDYKSGGFDPIVGVPCSQFKLFLQDLVADASRIHIPATREDEALAIAVGAYLAGKKPAVYLQNSGLGHIVDIITSTLKPYDIDIHLIISDRKWPIQHEFMHKITKRLLRLLEYKNYTLLRHDL